MAKDLDKEKEILSGETEEETETTGTADAENDAEDTTEDKDTPDTSDEKTDKKTSGITPEATFDSPNGKSVHRPIVYVELALAIIALVFIIVVIVSQRNKNNPDGSVTPGTSGDAVTTVSDGTAVLPDGTVPTEIDNSSIDSMKPAVPDIAAMNAVSEAACETKTAEGTMIRLDCADGTYVYVENYKDADLLASRLSISEADIDKMIKEEILDVMVVPAPADYDTAQMGDTANIDYCGKKDGVAFDGGTAQGTDLGLGSGQFIPGFEEGVVGMKIGETKDIPLTFPENYPAEDLAGQEVIFTVTLNSLKTYASELTDEIADYVTDGEYTTASEMRSFLRDNYILVEKMKSFLMDDLYVGGLTEETVNEYYDLQIKQLEDMAAGYGMSLENFLTMQGYGVQEVLDQVMSESASAARVDVLYRAVLENDLEPIQDSDITDFAQNEVTTNGYGISADQFIEENGRDNLFLYLQRDKASAYLQELADKAASVSDNSEEETPADETESDNTATAEPDADADATEVSE